MHVAVKGDDDATMCVCAASGDKTDRDVQESIFLVVGGHAAQPWKECRPAGLHGPCEDVRRVCRWGGDVVAEHVEELCMSNHDVPTIGIDGWRSVAGGDRKELPMLS